MDDFLELLIDNLTDIPKEKRKEIKRLLESNIKREIRNCKRDIMAVLVEHANKNLSIYDSVVKINQLYEDEKTEEKTNGSLGSETPK
jgi:endonuclease III-like uncharacterized protein